VVVSRPGKQVQLQTQRNQCDKLVLQESTYRCVRNGDFVGRLNG
jgi:hypothetical protein